MVETVLVKKVALVLLKGVVEVNPVNPVKPDQGSVRTA